MNQLWLIPILPLLGFLANGIFGRRFPKALINALAVGSVALSFLWVVKTLLGLYVPPDPQHMQQAFQAGKASLNKGSGTADLVFHDYALPGDQMTLSFDTAAKKISTVKVATYLDDPKDVVTLAVQFASLPDSTNYVQQTVLDATAKQLVVTTTNSDYKAIGR